MDEFGSNNFKKDDNNSAQFQGGYSENSGDRNNGFISAPPQNNGYSQYGEPPRDNMNGANGYNYQQPYKSAYPNQWDPRPNEKGTSGMAIASFVIAIVNLILFRTLLSVIAVPLSLIFAIVSLAKKFGGKGFAIAGIIISLISTFVFCSAIAVCVKLYPDFRYFAVHEQQIIEEYHENGTIPEQFEKYNAPRYNKYWTAFGCKDFNEFFGKIIDNFASETDEASSDRSYDGYDGYDGEYDDELDLGVKDLAFSVYYPY